MSTARGRRPPRWLLPVLALALAFVLVRLTGVVDIVSDEERLTELVDDAGWIAPVLYTIAFAVLVAVGVPGLALVLPAAVVFPAPVAIAVCLAAGYTSSGAGVWFARTVGRDAVATRMPARFRTWDERIAERGLLAVIGLRFVTYLAAPADWILGLSSIPTRTLMIGTGIGLLPPTLLSVIGGGHVFDLIL